MIRFKQKKLRSLKKYASFLAGKKLLMCAANINDQEILAKIGFSKQLALGEKVLPSRIGPVSNYNAEGRELIRKDLPKETHYNTIESPNWGDFYYGTHTVNLPYQKYPRDLIAPPSVELKISQGKIVSPLMDFPRNEQLILHTINLFLEIFGECELIDENSEDFLTTPTRNLNWEVLPAGQMPWEKMKGNLTPILQKMPAKDREACKDRIKTLESYNPDFSATGSAGFSGYVILGFQGKNLYICESIWPGNATYVFEENWEKLSQKTKAEILGFGLHKARIIHREHWRNELDELLK